VKQFHEDGIAFQYPENWRLDREATDDGWTVLLQSPDTAFLVVSYDPNLPTTEEMAETALEALREDYPELEAEPHVDTLAGQMAVGHDVRFFSLDLTNTCWIRSFYGDAGTVLVMCQSNDLELEQNEPILRAICASMRVEE
jgi:hypothetical protein